MKKTLSDCAKTLRDTLAPVGFSLKSSTWRRDAGEFIDIIGFERPKSGNAWFTVEVGVLTKTVYETVWGKQVPDFPRQYNCTVHDSLSALFSNRSRWWDMNDPGLLLEIAGYIRTSAIPFLEEMHSHERQIRYLRERTHSREWVMPIYEAVLMFECGEQDEACAKLRDYKSRYGNEALQKRLAEIRARLNCPSL